jgi:hypothetical protein
MASAFNKHSSYSFSGSAVVISFQKSSEQVQLITKNIHFTKTLHPITLTAFSKADG